MLPGMSHAPMPHASAARTPEQAWIARDYVSSVRTGCGLIRFTWALTIIVILVMVVISLLPTMRVRIDGDAMQVVAYGSLGALMLAGLLNTIGVFMYTTGDPRMALGQSAAGVRTAMRVCALAALLLAIVGLALTLSGEDVEPTNLGGSRSSPTLTVNPLGMGLGLASGVCAFVVAVGIVAYTGWLASRVPDAGLAERAQRLKPLVVFVYAATALFSAAGKGLFIYLMMQVGAGPWPALIVLLVFMILPIIAIIRMWGLLTGIKRHLDALHGAATQTAAQGSPML